MRTYFSVFAIPLCMMLAASPVRALDDTDDLKAVAIEALITAPENRALPIVTKLLRSDEDVDLKSRALFVLGQMRSNDAVSLIVEMAQSQDPAIQSEAIRMIGVGGNRVALDAIKEIYLTGDRDVRKSVLEAYLIAGDSDGILKIAQSAESSEDFEDAVEMLGAMGASAELTALRGQFGSSEALIDAYGVAGDFDSLASIAQDNSDPDAQIQALQGLGIVGGERVGELLSRIFRTTP
ncbi:MAG: HEAT repeat domain-containing protein, partial [Pseudomonadota bacterium]